MEFPTGGPVARDMKGNLNKKFHPTDLNDAFQAIKNSGSFAGWDALPTTPPARFLFEGIGEIGLPLHDG
ncbi:hypothetical protein PtA15_9A27 [Puccinia triticina]|uniref:Uncharacterized protein n=1 Tax=Puccinia triticina TaxID=208348 RepID=A0ABY7CSJ9_9BASI|nr:uncharacterized protein PtA15_9A27 [Puccinia triticina]WAQ87903.1 hypothetical protein PtA15_9A27 [Puccinia triticina]WAR60093.1 hypothetical protein PtB15_9B30 [Puccinia triticina]